jgi:hypothetical protein
MFTQTYMVYTEFALCLLTKVPFSWGKRYFGKNVNLV